MFAPRTFDVGCSTFAVCLWRTSKLHPFLDCHTDRHTEKLFSATFPFPYWLLLLGGDVELNPGQVHSNSAWCSRCTVQEYSLIHQGHYSELSVDPDVSKSLCLNCLQSFLPQEDLNVNLSGHSTCNVLSQLRSAHVGVCKKCLIVHFIYSQPAS